MRVVGWLVTATLVFGVTACGSGGSSGSPSSSAARHSVSGPAAGNKAMPDVVGKTLDVAEEDIKSAGGDPDSIKEIGGGSFGIVEKANWTVCSQSPKAGEALPAEPQLTVARSCDSASSGSSAAATGSPAASAPLTAQNSPAFAALLKVKNGCDAEVSAFATKYAGQDVEFDGSVSAMGPHGQYRTRYDILIGPGDLGGNTALGPNFQFRNVNTTADLHFTGEVEESIGVGTKLHIVATVGDYTGDNSCLLLLKPVSTQFR